MPERICETSMCCVARYFVVCMQMPLVHAIGARKAKALTRLHGYELSIRVETYMRACVFICLRQ